MIYYTNPNMRVFAWNSSCPPEWLIALIEGENK